MCADFFPIVSLKDDLIVSRSKGGGKSLVGSVEHKACYDKDRDEDEEELLVFSKKMKHRSICYF